MATALKTKPAKTTKAPKTSTPLSKVPKKGGKFESRAVRRLVQPGSWIDCVACGEQVKFQARMQHAQAICNVYTNGVWERVEHYHDGCYEEIGNPYGEMAES